MGLGIWTSPVTASVVNKLHVPWSFPELIHFLLFGNRISETKCPQSVTGPSTLKHVQDLSEALRSDDLS